MRLDGLERGEGGFGGSTEGSGGPRPTAHPTLLPPPDAPPLHLLLPRNNQTEYSNPLYGMLDPRYAPPEELVMPKSELSLD